MVIGKVKPNATIVAQFAAGVEVKAIKHEGIMYLPVVTAFSADDEEEKSTPVEKEPKKTSPSPKKSVEKEPEADSPSCYTEEDLMDKDVRELTKILKNEFNVDPNDYDGKNTNKKLRNLILDMQEKGADDAGKGDEGDEKDSSDDADGSSDSKGDDLVGEIGDILEDFDSGKKNKKKTIEAIVALSDDADEDSVAKLVEKFEADGDLNIDDIAEEIAGTFEKKPKKAAKKSRASRKSDEELVDVDDLKVGDRVSVWWDDDNKDWFDGTVKSVRGGKVKVEYDDDTTDVIDPKVHTKIKRLAD